MEVRVGVPLKDFYNGHTTEFQLEKQMICEECEGSGSADGIVVEFSAWYALIVKCGFRGIINGVRTEEEFPG